MKCEFCGKEFTSKYGFPNHVRRCPNNPSRILEVTTPEGVMRKKMAAKEQNATMWTVEKRAAHSKKMKEAVQNFPDSYTKSNRGRTKKIEIDGISLQGKWEVDFYLWAKSNQLNPQRPNVGVKYEWNGNRIYFPDFYIPSLDLFVEVKGYETDRDRAKWRDFPGKLCIIKAAEIMQIRKGTFAGLVV